ncbi:hypothetical protein NDU88_007505 [Pleurodeles waltl]|uniref:Uncharacterized protein n=1 Tax=Pleurodeles waltl TaxID=8319 RepID=A0AAV7PMU2_PLEWA|nr:hypothetical protein NDU88_007505 [Pleurodeles waltl]
MRSRTALPQVNERAFDVSALEAVTFLCCPKGRSQVVSGIGAGAARTLRAELRLKAARERPGRGRRGPEERRGVH